MIRKMFWENGTKEVFVLSCIFAQRHRPMTRAPPIPVHDMRVSRKKRKHERRDTQRRWKAHPTGDHLEYAKGVKHLTKHTETLNCPTFERPTSVCKPSRRPRSCLFAKFLVKSAEICTQSASFGAIITLNIDFAAFVFFHLMARCTV